MTSAYKRVITIATKAEFKDKRFYDEVWKRAREVSLSISRRKWLDVISDSLMREDIEIIEPNKDPFNIPEVDEVFGDDPDMRWMSYYLQADASGAAPRIHVSCFPRLQLIDLYLKAECSEEFKEQES